MADDRRSRSDSEPTSASTVEPVSSVVGTGDDGGDGDGEVGDGTVGEGRNHVGGSAGFEHERARASVLRFLLFVAIVAAVAVGGFVYGPELAGSIESARDDPRLPGGASPPSNGSGPTDPGDPGETAYGDTNTTITSTAVEERVHEVVNERRAEHGLAPLERDATIASVSRAHSADMHERDFFAHENPDGDGPMERFRAVDDYCRRYGENVATTWVDRNVERSADGEVVEYDAADELAQGLVRQWLASQPHREAMLSDAWERGGVGVYLTSDGEVFATHNFCRTW